MALHRCAQCGHLAEVPNEQIGQKLNCIRCGQPGMAHDTVMFVGKLLERYFASRREIEALREATRESSEGDSPEETAPAAGTDSDDGNSRALTTPEQHAPLERWLSGRRIQARFDHEAVDTTGFFDEAAELLAVDPVLGGDLLGRVRWAYRKDVPFLNIRLSEMSQKEAQAYNSLCQKLYGYSFFSKYAYLRNDKVIRLTLQQAPTIRRFFDGGWLEWLAFMTLMRRARQRGKGFSCARNAQIVFDNEDLHELDVVMLVNGQTQPICIECKTGEFRADIPKMVRLRQRLGLDRRHFIVCATELDPQQALGMTAMYELNFVTPEHLGELLESLL